MAKSAVLLLLLLLTLAEGRYLPTRSGASNLDRLRDMIRNVLTAPHPDWSEYPRPPWPAAAHS